MPSKKNKAKNTALKLQSDRKKREKQANAHEIETSQESENIHNANGSLQIDDNLPMTRKRQRKEKKLAKKRTKYHEQLEIMSESASTNIPQDANSSRQNSTVANISSSYFVRIPNDRDLQRITLSTVDQNSDHFISQIAALYGMDVVKVAGDGSCFYHAIAHQLQRLGLAPHDYLTIRNMTANYFENLPNRLEYVLFLEGSQNLETRLRHVLHGIRNTEWANDATIRLTADVLNINIAIIRTTAPSDPVIISPRTGVSQHTATICLRGEIHYDALIPRPQVSVSHNNSNSLTPLNNPSVTLNTRTTRLRSRENARDEEVRRPSNSSVAGNIRRKDPRKAINFNPQTDLVTAHNIGHMNYKCKDCGAHKFSAETSAACCSNGKVKIPDLQDPPETISELLDGTDTKSKVFRKYSRVLNNNLAMASLKINTTQNVGFHPFITLHGRMMYQVGPLLPYENQRPRYAQLWVHDPAHEGQHSRFSLGPIRLPNSTTSNDKIILEDLLKVMHTLLPECNPYVRDFRYIANVSSEDNEEARFIINGEARPLGQHERRYSPNLKEVAVLIGDRPGPRDFIVRVRGGGLRTMNEQHRSYDPLHFVLLFPHGEDGWTPQTQYLGKKITPLQFYSYRLQTRDDCSHLTKYARLFQEYGCVSYAKVVNDRLEYDMKRQLAVRGDVYQNVIDALNSRDEAPIPDSLSANSNDQEAQDNHNRIGKRIILSPNFVDGPRYMNERYQDAMRIVSKYGKPDLFITMTFNPQWPEFQEQLRPGETPQDRPDLVSRIFKLKYNALRDEIVKCGIFGKVYAHLETIEYQGRGLPHVHMLFTLIEADKPQSPELIDIITTAELPADPETIQDPTLKAQAQRLEDLVVTNMLHGPCPGRPCWVDGKCTKHYPKPYNGATYINERFSYPVYKRTSPEDGGRTIIRNGRVITNADVVPYNPYLLLKYGSHINVETCGGIGSAKYIYKYVSKGNDRRMIDIVAHDKPDDEISQYLDMRSIGACEAFWRLYKFPICRSYPPVKLLHVHLPFQNYVIYNDADEIRQRPEIQTELQAFFEYNRINPETNYTYMEFPEYFTLQTCKETRNKMWKPRQNESQCLGRLQMVHPNAREKFYLRLLLHNDHSRGKTSFDHLQSVDGQPCGSFKEVCKNIGLLRDDYEFHQALTEAAHTKLCSTVRQLFVIIVVHCCPSDTRKLFDDHYLEWIDDIRTKFNDDVDPEILRAAVLLDLERRFSAYSLTLEQIQLDTVSDDLRLTVTRLINEAQRERNPLLQEQLQFNTEENVQLLRDRLEGACRMNAEQRSCFDTIMNSVETNQGGCFFLDAPGGCGKTFLENTLLAAIRTSTTIRSPVAIAVASSGIAATLLEGGRTFHSRFKAPINIEEDSCLNITAQSNLANLLRQTSLILWDEAPMAHRFLLEALDRTLRDIKNCPNSLFGGITILLAGDFRQVLPVVVRGSRPAIVGACVQCSPLWQHFTILTLSQNMRICTSGPPARIFAEWLLKLGSGQLPHVENDSAKISLDPEMCLPARHDTVINWVYPNISFNYSNRDWIINRAILAPTNKIVNEINEKMTAIFPGNLKVLLSVDKLENEDDSVHVSTDFLSSFNPASIPCHRLELKIKMPLILLRNISPTTGLCNGTRLILEEIHGHHLLRVQIANGENAGQIAFIPRITMFSNDSDGLPYKWSRHQFPVRPAFAMTTNKSQGQTLKHVAVWLEPPVFSHGQLYVAASRVGDPNCLKFCVKDNTTDNVVYHEVLGHLRS